MKKLFILFLVVGFVACKSKRDQSLDSIRSMEQGLMSDSAKREIDPAKGRALITAYMDFSKANPNDTMAPELLFKAAELANGMRAPVEALEYYSLVYSKFPNYSKAPLCLFLQGFIYENNLRNAKKAKEFYELFLKSYPNHPLANDVRFSLQHVGMSDEELIKMFESQNQANTAVQ